MMYKPYLKDGPVSLEDAWEFLKKSRRLIVAELDGNGWHCQVVVRLEHFTKLECVALHLNNELGRDDHVVSYEFLGGFERFCDLVADTFDIQEEEVA